MIKTLFAPLPLFWLVLSFAMPRAQAADGKQLFQDNKCNTCHSIKSQQVESTKKGDDKIVDLSKVGNSHDSAWIKQWLNKEAEKDGKKHKKKWSGSEGDLDTLVNWLASLKG